MSSLAWTPGYALLMPISSTTGDPPGEGGRSGAFPSGAVTVAVSSNDERPRRPEPPRTPVERRCYLVSLSTQPLVEQSGTLTFPLMIPALAFWICAQAAAGMYLVLSSETPPFFRLRLYPCVP